MKKHMALMTLAGTLLMANLASAASGDFLGAWANSNRSTRNIVRAEITPDKMIRLFGACTPTPCDMGKVPLVTYGRSISDANHKFATAQYNLSFKKVVVTVKILGGNRMYLETYNQFTDGSNRKNKWVGQSFRK